MYSLNILTGTEIKINIEIKFEFEKIIETITETILKYGT